MSSMPDTIETRWQNGQNIGKMVKINGQNTILIYDGSDLP
jgi:hypothetical protein